MSEEIPPLPDNVVLFPGAMIPNGFVRTKLDDVLQGVRDRGIRDVVALGWTPTGEIDVASESDDLLHVLALITACQASVADMIRRMYALPRGRAASDTGLFEPPDDAA